MEFELVSVVTALSYALGLVLAPVALWRSRTYQGATAWVVALIGFPLVAVPAFLIFGRNKFYGYVKDRRELDGQARREVLEAEKIFEFQCSPPQKQQALAATAQRAYQPGFTAGNKIRLLKETGEAYDCMIEEIGRAKNYIIFQFYIFREDEAGRRFTEALIRKAGQGVKIYFLYDKIGTGLSRRLVRRLEEAGIQVQAFQSTKTLISRLQINFRNHRKVVIVDGKVAFLGGLNIGDDYLGLWPSIGPWRDAHVRLEGPSALAVQFSFMKDWYWAKGEAPDLDWTVNVCDGGSGVLVLHTSPADDGEICLMAHLTMILSATERVWIANPYFVPSEGLSNALTIAALRGVDVRIMIPNRSDNLLVDFAAKPHVKKLLMSGVQFYKYMPGFSHQKVMLVDDEVGMVGSANLDARSFFINFEIMAISDDKNFATDLHKMFEKDFAQSQNITLAYFEGLPFWRKLMGRAANLLAPMI